MGFSKVLIVGVLISAVSAVARDDSLFRAPVCPDGGYILPRSGCLIWCRQREVLPGLKMRVVDFSIGNRTDGTPCIGVRPSDSASNESDESYETSESTGSDIKTSSASSELSSSATRESGQSSNSGEAGQQSSSGSDVEVNSESEQAADSSTSENSSSQSEKASNESKRGSNESEESYEYVVDPLFLGECLQGVCRPIFK